MRDIIFVVSYWVAKHASDKRVTCPRVADTRKFLLPLRYICVSLTTNFVARHKVSEVAKMGDVRGYATRHNVARVTISLCLGRP